MTILDRMIEFLDDILQTDLDHDHRHRAEELSRDLALVRLRREYA